jgi:GMP synthase-like glutamine amidotransferase
MRYCSTIFLCSLFCFANVFSAKKVENPNQKTKKLPHVHLTAPKLTNNPSWDIIATNKRPLLSFFNSKGGLGRKTYHIQIDKTPLFNSSDLIEYKNILKEDKYLTSKLVDVDLDDNALYYWRVRAIDSKGTISPWAISRFYLDSKSDDSFMNLTRIPICKITVSSGVNPKNINDWDDPGQVSFWQSTPPGSSMQWIVFDLGKSQRVKRIWMLSSIKSIDGWLKDFVWQVSNDGKNWKNIPKTKIVDNDTFRNILDFPIIEGRYFRLLISDWYGYAAQINAIILYTPGKPSIPVVPKEDYVLLIGNQMNGFTFTELQDFIEGLDLNLKAVVVPHYEASMDMLSKLNPKPIAIILSGNNVSYQNLPMYEYNGVYEIIRKSNIPILGICCGHQLTVMAYGYTYARGMGWEDITSLVKYKDRTRIKIVKKDPIFEGIPSPFTAPEIHGWAVVHLPKDYEVLAKSSYIQALKSKSKMLYGEQFHAEIKRPYNQGTPYLINFLKMALKHSSLPKKKNIQGK